MIYIKLDYQQADNKYYCLTFIAELYTETKLVTKSKYRVKKTIANRICERPDNPKKSKFNDIVIAECPGL